MALPSFRSILVFGQHGQVAGSLHRLWGQEAKFLSSHACPFEDSQSISAVLEETKPDLVIICSAYTKVDKAESDRALADRVNARAPGEIATWCAQNSASLVFFSTDYVYSGDGNEPWMETSQCAPSNFYGQTKWDGEKAVQESGCRHLILRTSWVYSFDGQNFLKTMLNLGKKKRDLNIVSDQVGSPNFSDDLASGLTDVLRNWKTRSEDGIYNFSGSEFTSWFDFAKEIFKIARECGDKLEIENLNAIRTTEYPTAARRPLNSRMNVEKLARTFDVRLPAWKLGLNRCMTRIYGN